MENGLSCALNGHLLIGAETDLRRQSRGRAVWLALACISVSLFYGESLLEGGVGHIGLLDSKQKCRLNVFVAYSDNGLGANLLLVSRRDSRGAFLFVARLKVEVLFVERVAVEEMGWPCMIDHRRSVLDHGYNLIMAYKSMHNHGT